MKRIKAKRYEITLILQVIDSCLTLRVLNLLSFTQINSQYIEDILAGSMNTLCVVT